ncbi:MAG: FixH family protein [Bacteroidetes bacterium]|nr:FixH family protein [Bacteroidota bacterium]MBS1630071.1 FixH family protein [Bacteroidota bacterium]
MTINWGTRILLLYVGFVALIGLLVWKSMHTKVNLVTEDYYAQELVFQKKLDAERASSLLAQKPVVSLTPKEIIIFFPPGFSGKNIEGHLQLYFAPDAALDRQFEHLQAHDGQISIPRKYIAQLKYTAKLSWTCEGTTYYQEYPLNLQAS